VNQMGALLADQIPVVTVNDWPSLEAAFNKRSNVTHEDDIDDDVFEEAMKILDEIPNQHGFFTQWEENDEDRARWLDKFDIHKRKRMEQGWLDAVGQTAAQLGKKDLSVKLEVLLKRDDPNWAPRIIYAGSDAFNAVTGPAMMVVMERLVELFSREKVGSVKVKACYKTDDADIVNFLDDHDTPHTYEGDFSSNDREQRKRVSLLFDKMMDVLKMSATIRELLIAMDVFKVVNYAYGLVSKLAHQLPTGTTATTPRNTVYNVIMFAVACARQQIPFARAAVLGDDILARCSRRFSVVEWKKVVDKFKMKLKGVEVDEWIGQATLLSRRIIISGEKKHLIPKLGKAVARFNARASLNMAISDSQYMAGKSLSYWFEFRFMPSIASHFKRRFEAEDSSNLALEDVSWMTKTSGLTIQEMVFHANTPKDVFNEDEELDWLMATYGIGLTDLHEILERTVNNKCIDFIESDIVRDLSIDW